VVVSNVGDVNICSPSACSAAVRAVDVVMKDYGKTPSIASGSKGGAEPVTKAFVIGRPPGHHAGPNG
jgi:acetoin utilization deacetylase AcuC-like enzyme